jgi:putative oxidoreductase
MAWVTLLSRVLMAAIFIQSGYGKAMHPSATMATLARYNLPLPGAAYTVSLLVELGVATVFLLGWNGRVAALVLAIWSVATAFVAHYHPRDTSQMIQFLKNMCMAGGFLQVFVYGSGKFSLGRK